MGDSEHVVFDIGAGCRAAHAGLAKPVERSLDDRGVCSFDGGRQSCGVGCLRRCLGNGLDGDGGGYLTGGVAAHAVAYAKERRLHQIGVFVMRATQPTSERAPHMSCVVVPAS